ncbi:serine hydrolase family protein [Ochrobactrum sp. Q0168]|uniref:alpha/beta hydrolase n=1 Tax=Ochrobactrum sp. Q0168 TaxID=2793241 RepID=UPI0018ED307F|nr:serine hydrolase family protein [Ochrobactrum sp. Q0168]
MPATLIIPGYKGSEAGHWQRQWLHDDPSALLVEQDDWHYPVLSDWMHALEAKLAENPGAVLVAHSLGCVLVAHLASRPAAAHVAGALLVAPADAETMASRDSRFQSFAPLPRHELGFPSIVVASRNDDYMRFAKAEALANVWGSGFVDLGHAGHINVASGFSRWPEGVILASSLQREPQKAASSQAAPLAA